MKKHKAGKKLSRKKDAKKALLVGLLRSLTEHGAIETSEARAKALKSFADKILSTVKKDNVAARRLVVARLRRDRQTTRLLFEEILPKAGDKRSGFTRIIRLGTRPGDRSKRVKVEWALSQNSKHEARNSKQTQSTKS